MLMLNTAEISQMAGTRGQGPGSELYHEISRLHIINHSVKGEMGLARIREIWITSPGFYISGIVRDGS